jgi:hypothetical protein
LIRPILLLLALLSSSASMAATVTIVPSNTDVFPDNTFTVTIHGDGFPETAGATLGLSFNSSMVSFVGAALPATGPFSAAMGSFLVPHPSTGAPATFDILAPLARTAPSGSFDAAIFTFRWISFAVGYANIQFIDNQNTLAWFDANTFDPIPVAYTQANVHFCVPEGCPPTPPEVPIPAVGWLLAPAFGVLGVKRRRTAA